MKTNHVFVNLIENNFSEDHLNYFNPFMIKEKIVYARGP